MDTLRIVPIPETLAENVRKTRRDGYGNIDIGPTRADSPRGYPCRVCLEDAQMGEELLLFSYSPFEHPAPYRNVGPIFVHAHSCTPYRREGVVPELMRGRLLALRSYDASDHMVECDLVEGAALESMVSRFFTNADAAYIHAHNARAGCFMCRIERAAP